MSGLFWIASYPKSGNTWLRLALSSLSRGGAAINFADAAFDYPLAAARDDLDLALDVETSLLTPDETERLRPRVYEQWAAELRDDQLRKVHDAWTLTDRGEPLFPPSVTRGVLYVVRDPRDVALSLAAFFSIEVDHAIARMGDPACEIGSRPGSTQCRQRLSTWSGHVTSWLEAPVPRCVVRYEDLLTDPALSLERMAGFLGWPVTPSSIDAAVEATSFDVLRAQERRDGFREGVRQRAIPFFRSGTAGGWRTSLLPAQLARIEQDHGETMRRLGYIAG